MAITNPTRAGPGTFPVERTAPWAVNNHTADFYSTGLTGEMKAAPGTRKATYLEHLTLSLNKDSVNGWLEPAHVSLVDGAGITVFGPIQLQIIGGGNFTKDWDPPLKITDNKALNFLAVGAGNVNYKSSALIYVEGFTAAAPIV